MTRPGDTSTGALDPVQADAAAARGQGAMASIVLWVEELRKLGIRAFERRRADAAAHTAPATRVS